MPADATLEIAPKADRGDEIADPLVRPMTGNEAFARGAWEAGVKVAAAYPGTPSTEILENLSCYPASDLHAQWSTNEKVACDVAIGASFAGVRAFTAMKHVGMNVAADALMSLTYIGVNGGLVLVVCDDPGIHSSQNEQDTRIYGRLAMVPVLEPSDAEAKRSWHACIEVRGAVLETLASSPWTNLMSAAKDKAEVYKAWTFSPSIV